MGGPGRNISNILVSRINPEVRQRTDKNPQFKQPKEVNENGVV
jgi:hypothetical protein